MRVIGVRMSDNLEQALEALVEEWRDRGVVDPYGMTWILPADELEALLEEHE